MRLALIFLKQLSKLPLICFEPGTQHSQISRLFHGTISECYEVVRQMKSVFPFSLHNLQRTCFYCFYCYYKGEKQHYITSPLGRELTIYNETSFNFILAETVVETVSTVLHTRNLHSAKLFIVMHLSHSLMKL